MTPDRFNETLGSIGWSRTALARKLGLKAEQRQSDSAMGGRQRRIVLRSG